MKEKTQMSIEQDKKPESSTSILLILKNTLKRISKPLLITFIAFFLNVESKYPIFPGATAEELNTMLNSEIYYTFAVRDKLQQELIEEVKSYIKFVSPDSKLDPKILVNLCQKHEIDITFVLAQGLLESRLGTAGRALSTHSVFGVGALDDGTIRPGCIYKNVNESIEPYLILLKTQYLGETKTLKDLIKDNSFKTLTGYRYASLENYESILRTYILKVEMNSSISMYQDLMNLPNNKLLAYFKDFSIESTLDISQHLANLN